MRSVLSERIPVSRARVRHSPATCCATLIADRRHRFFQLGHLGCTEVSSTDWSFRTGEHQCRGDDDADQLWAEPDSVERLPSALEQGDVSFTWARRQPSSSLPAALSGCRWLSLACRSTPGTDEVQL